MELIAFNDHGAPVAMLTALLHRGNELRLHLAQGNASPAAPTCDYAPDAASPVDTSDYPDPWALAYRQAGCMVIRVYGLEHVR